MTTTKPTLSTAAKTVMDSPDLGVPKNATTDTPSRRGKIGWVIYLDPATHRRAKAAAALAGLSMQRAGEQAADELIERHLDV